MKRSKLKRKPPRRKPGDVDRAYVAWVKTLPCCVCVKEGPEYQRHGISGGLYEGCVQTSPTEAHHAGDHAYGRRAPDRTAIPLCGHEHHREGSDSAHVLGKHFWAHHGIDRDALIARLNQEYECLV